LHNLFTVCLSFAANRKGKETRAHAVDTLSIILRTVLAKNLAGWEVMEVFAGQVNDADRVFMVQPMCTVSMVEVTHWCMFRNL
jgi:hypothetical protein